MKKATKIINNIRRKKMNLSSIYHTSERVARGAAVVSTSQRACDSLRVHNESHGEATFLTCYYISASIKYLFTSLALVRKTHTVE